MGWISERCVVRPAPPTDFVLGDVRVGKIIAPYRSGGYDRFIQ